MDQGPLDGLRQRVSGDALAGHLLDAIPANVAIIDAGGRIAAVNRAWRAFAHGNAWSAPDAGIGLDYVDLCAAASHAGDATAAAVHDGLTAVLSGAADTFSLEYPCHSPAAQRWFTCLIAPLPLGTDGTGAVVMHIDITARRLAEERVAGQNRARYDFICALAHEIRSPLQAVIGFAELIERQSGEGRSDGKHMEYLGLMRQSGLHILDVVNNVLDLTKAEAGCFTLELERVPLREVADFAADTMSALAARAGVVVRRDDAHGADRAAVRGDRRLLRQSLINVISNAIKVSPSGSEVEVAVDPPADGRVAIRVADRGPGIASQDLERIMEPFVQIGPRNGVMGLGTGLGLPLARMFLRLHGGDIALASAPGEGTVVTLWLPDAPPADGAAG